jgi:hypothetical protein
MSQAETIVALACALIAVGCLYGAIPWMTRCGSLYMLHNLRDNLYEVGDESPAARDTLIYLDTEFVVTLAIHVVRDLSYRDAAGYLTALVRAENGQQDGPRAKQYHLELDRVFVGQSGAKALTVMRDVVERVPSALALRVTFGHPVVMAAVTVGAGVSMLLSAIRGKKPAEATVSGPSPESRLSTAVEVPAEEPDGRRRSAQTAGLLTMIRQVPKMVSDIRRDPPFSDGAHAI